MKTVTITKAKVHAALRKAGLSKSYTYPLRIRGMRERVQGYGVGETDTVVYVQLLGRFTFMTREEMLKREGDAMKDYARALEAFSPRIVGHTNGRLRCEVTKLQPAQSRPPRKATARRSTAA